MYKKKLGLFANPQYGIGVIELIRLFKKAGFEGFFTEWDENIENYRRVAMEEDMIYQSVHAPFTMAATMWKEEAGATIAELIKCVETSAKCGVPIVVMHAYIGFDKSAGPTVSGIKNFGRVVEAAKKVGIKIAFENTEGEEYLDALMNAFANESHVGFCWDTGHELCYNRGKDMMSLYGNRLLCTHLNDNLGIHSFEGDITWTDDLHLLPFDGVVDWAMVTKRLNQVGFDDMLTFELNTQSKPDRNDNRKYEKMQLEEYIAEAYARACAVAVLMGKE